MNCPKCGCDVSVSGASYCPFCGASVTVSGQSAMRRTRSRGNGQGSVYKRGNKWIAQAIVGYRLPKKEGGYPVPVKRTKSFSTKRDAIAYIPQLKLETSERRKITLEQLWKEWNVFYESRVGESTMAGYKAAYQKLKPLHGSFMDAISIGELQKCMNSCDTGIRTKRVLKTTCGLLWQYAVDHNMADRDITDSLYTGKGESVQREPLTVEEVETIRKNIGRYRYAEYIYCLVFLGFRPGELLELKKEQLHHYIKKDDHNETIADIWYLISGKKTEAGKNRIVPIPQQILDYVLERMMIPGTDLLFPMYQFNRKKESFLHFKTMTDEYLNKHVFKPMTESLGIAKGKVPYSARHSFADMLKEADGTDKNKAAIIGHSDYLFTQQRYQSVTLEELARIAETLKRSDSR